jgi:hypothetical protein
MPRLKGKESAMISERKVAKSERGTKVKGIKPERENNQPYASEIEDYASAALKGPDADLRRKDGAPEDAADQDRPLSSGRSKTH